MSTPRPWPPSSTDDAFAKSLSSARVDLNPHQVDAALFALSSPISRGVIPADARETGKPFVHPFMLVVAQDAALIATAVTESVGVLAALFARTWMGAFTSDPAVLDAGAHYLHVVAPGYGAVALGMMLYFACQGRGRMLWPFIAGIARLVVAAGGGLMLAEHEQGMTAVFAAVLAGSVAYGTLNVLGMRRACPSLEPARATSGLTKTP